ncbi:MAG: neutral/alkaline non-lysosomal ceramidase N-terminal domain-containing protein [Myxococcota bacterium]|nr:neutral/alkaline non-lysosomal ceramidase N-terminal domain-containing protein [Myxococcota bacterium]
MKNSIISIVILVSMFVVSCEDSCGEEGCGEAANGEATDAITDDGQQPTHAQAPDACYNIGTGIFDITGPPAEVMFGGYADFSQIGTGVYMRQWSRAYIMHDMRNDKRIVMVTADIPLMSAGVYVHVIKKLKETYGDLYTEKNVMASASHTHSGPGGYFKTYALNIFVGMTYHEDNFNTIVNGIYRSIVSAHENLEPGRVYMSSAEFSAEKFDRVNFQRSNQAYVLNRDKGDYTLPNGTLDNTSRTLTQFKFITETGRPIGAYHWAPIHPNVSGNRLTLINGDINGLASYKFEKAQGTDYLDNTDFVAAFAYNNAGDISNNLPEDAYLPELSECEKEVTVENGEIVAWRADGNCDYERMGLRAAKVYDLAKSLFDGNGTELRGLIDSRQMFAAAQGIGIKPEYIDIEDIYYTEELNETIDTRRLCMGAAGVGFFAGSTEDGDSGMVNAGEGNPRDVTDYSVSNLGDLIADPVPSLADIILRTLVHGDELYDEMDCQMEKKMTMSFDELNKLIPEGKPWSLNQPIQILKIGNVATIALPFEVATMAGRRLQDELMSALPDVDEVMINSTANADMRYLVTREEYASQQYEGGAALMGPYSLNAVRMFVNELAQTFTPGVDLPDYAVDIATVEDGLEKEAVFKVAGYVVFDDKPLLQKFGAVHTQPDLSYTRGQDTASAVFWGAHPNNNLTVDAHESYLVIEKFSGFKACYEGDTCEEPAESAYGWEPMAHDWDPSTQYHWKRDGAANSHVTIEWDIPASASPGFYRIRQVGYWKSGWTGEIERYEGASRAFLVM